MPLLWLKRLIRRGPVSEAARLENAVAAIEDLLRVDRERRKHLEAAQESLRGLVSEIEDDQVLEAVRQEISGSRRRVASDPEWRRWLKRYQRVSASQSMSFHWATIILEKLRERSRGRSEELHEEANRFLKICELFEDAAMHPAICEVEGRRAALARLAFFDLEAAMSLRNNWVFAEASRRMRATELRRLAWRRVQTYESVMEVREGRRSFAPVVHQLAVRIRSATGVPGVGFWDVAAIHQDADTISGEFY